MEDKSVEELETQYKNLCARRNTLQNDVNRIAAARDERKRSLKDTIDKCKKEGLNPDTLLADIQHIKQVLITKMDVISADLNEAESITRPMLREIDRT